MKDPFKKNTDYGSANSRPQYGPRNFMFETGMALPIQILNPPEDLFPDGFPLIKRHWITRQLDGGKVKYLPPVNCSKEYESTHGNCLVCYAKSMNLITADRGNPEPSEEMVIPIYDHTKYRKVDDKYRPMNPAMPIMDPNMQNQLLVGGLKIMLTSEGQYRKIRAEHDNLQNECKACNGQMMLEGLVCEDCGAPAYEPGQLAMLNSDDFNRVRYSEHTCDVCSHSGILDTQRKCRSCGAMEPKTIFDSVLFAARTETQNRKGKPRKEYTFSAATGYELAQIDEQELREFWEKLDAFVRGTGVTIQQQSEKLGVQPPQEWLQAPTGSAQAARSYGA